jgi:hypothetical protein
MTLEDLSIGDKFRDTNGTIWKILYIHKGWEDYPHGLVTAEMIEDPNDYYLENDGCTVGQWYLFDRSCSDITKVP